jgi:hypothetical protein
MATTEVPQVEAVHGAAMVEPMVNPVERVYPGACQEDLGVLTHLQANPITVHNGQIITVVLVCFVKLRPLSNK